MGKTGKTSKMIKIAVGSILGIQRVWFPYGCMRFVAIIMGMHWFSMVVDPKTGVDSILGIQTAKTSKTSKTSKMSQKSP